MSLFWVRFKFSYQNGKYDDQIPSQNWAEGDYFAVGTYLIEKKGLFNSRLSFLIFVIHIRCSRDRRFILKALRPYPKNIQKTQSKALSLKNNDLS